MVEIELRARDGSVRAVALVDDEDAGLARFRWQLGTKGYAIRTVPLTEGRTTTVRMHRDIMGLERGDPREVDHINRDPLDNRRSNLRVCSRGQNQQNRASLRGSASRFRGVTPHRRQGCWTGQWKAQVRVDGRYHYLGLFSDEEVAAAVAARFRATHMPFAVEAAC